ncbi:MAG: zinc ribbon domain-containing protein [bacterium]
MPSYEDNVQLILALIKQLQEIDEKKADIELSRQYLPRRINDLKNELQNVKMDLERYRQKDIDVKKNIKLLELEVQELRERLKKSKERLLNVRTNKEYDAVQAEIDVLESKIAQVEEEILSLMEESEKIDKIKGELELKYKRVEDENPKAISEAEKNLARLDSEIEQIQNEWDRIARDLPQNIVEEYKTMRAKQNIVVAFVRNNSCGACFAVITPQTIQELRRGRRIIRCENCGRFLILEEK